MYVSRVRVGEFLFSSLVLDRSRRAWSMCVYWVRFLGASSTKAGRAGSTTETTVVRTGGHSQLCCVLQTQHYSVVSPSRVVGVLSPQSDIPRPSKNILVLLTRSQHQATIAHLLKGQVWWVFFLSSSQEKWVIWVMKTVCIKSVVIIWNYSVYVCAIKMPVPQERTGQGLLLICRSLKSHVFWIKISWKLYLLWIGVVSTLFMHQRPFLHSVHFFRYHEYNVFCNLL